MSSGSRSIVCPKFPIVNIRRWRSTSCLSHIACNAIYSERPIPLSFLKLDDALSSGKQPSGVHRIQSPESTETEDGMNTKQVALYARVSSEQQAEAKTIESQLAEIRARITADGFEQNRVLEFVDEGYSGSTLVRPALERLRDVAAAGGLDRLYVHCPDRFARNYAYQVLLLDELNQQGVEVIFLNSASGADSLRSVTVASSRSDCRIRASQIPRTKPTRKASCCPCQRLRVTFGSCEFLVNPW